MYIDTHAHLNFSVYKDDVDFVIRKSLSEKVWMIIPGTDYKTSKLSLSIANRFEKGVYSAVGLHPTHLEDYKNDKGILVEAEKWNFDIYEKLAKFEKVLAIGEVGLDYYNLPNKNISKIKEKQKFVLYEQIRLARLLDKPVIIHCRQAHDDLILLLQKFRKEHPELMPKNKIWGVIHCFSGNEDLAWKYFSFGLIISFTGLITFSKQWDDLIRKVPMDKIMIETDSPFMTPEPYRGKRNEPVYVKKVAERIAIIKNLSIERVANATTENAVNLFKIK